MLCDECRRAITYQRDLPARPLGLIMVGMIALLVLGTVICWPLFN